MNDLETKRLNYPRVSEIISPFTRKDYENISLETLVHAAERGTKVHAYCTGIALGEWVPEIEEECKPYVESFQKWFSENVKTTIAVEEATYDDELMFKSNGFDMIVQIKDSEEHVLIDLKTSANPSKSWPIQLAAYHHLVNLHGYDITSVANIHLKKSGAIGKEVNAAMDVSKDWEIFKQALNLYNHFIRKEAPNA